MTEYIGDTNASGTVPVQQKDEAGNPVPSSERQSLAQQMLLELKAIRLGLQSLLDTDEDLLELATECEDEVPY